MWFACDAAGACQERDPNLKVPTGVRRLIFP
jgi:hypothetical protein